jgi:hypothetical protein
MDNVIGMALNKRDRYTSWQSMLQIKECLRGNTLCRKTEEELLNAFLKHYRKG